MMRLNAGSNRSFHLYETDCEIMQYEELLELKGIKKAPSVPGAFFTSDNAGHTEKQTKALLIFLKQSLFFMP